VLLIADEDDRLRAHGTNFAVDHWGVVPDILVAGKGLAGGYAPMGGVYASDAVLAPLAARGEEFLFYTYAAHPASCAAALAVLGIIEREGLVARAAEQGKRLQGRLQAALADHPHVAEVRGLGLLIAVELVRDRALPEPGRRFANRVIAAGFAGALYPGSGRRRGVCLGPPFTINDEKSTSSPTALPRAINDIPSNRCRASSCFLSSY
jgi:adenosylmethionine-8-amino-7-oxononanoate aminotransferase